MGILSMHIYPESYTQGRHTQASDIYFISGAEFPCVLGEFGTRQTNVESSLSSGSVDISAVVNFAKSRGCAVLGWAWNGDGGTMNMVTPSWKDDAKAQSFSKSGYFDSIYNLLGASSEAEKTLGNE